MKLKTNGNEIFNKPNFEFVYTKINKIVTYMVVLSGFVVLIKVLGEGPQGEPQRHGYISCPSLVLMQELSYAQDAFEIWRHRTGTRGCVRFLLPAALKHAAPQGRTCICYWQGIVPGRPQEW